MIESGPKPPLSEAEKLTPPSKEKYLPGVHTNQKIEAQKAARRIREAEVTGNSEILIAKARGTIETIDAIAPPNSNPDELRITFPERAKKSRWSLKNLFSRN